jgi:hypothetical protein
MIVLYLRISYPHLDFDDIYLHYNAQLKLKKEIVYIIFLLPFFIIEVLIVHKKVTHIRIR